MGDILYQQGQLTQAKSAYEDAQTRVTSVGAFTSATVVVEAEVRLARIAIFTGNLSEATSHLAKVAEVMKENTLAAQVAPMASVIRGQLFLTQGDLTQAEARFSEAHDQAEAQQEPLQSAEALLGLAQTRLAREELEAALNSFLAAGRQFQQVESVDGDGSAALGIAQVYLGQQQWDEALENCEAALVRFNQASDQLGQADTLLTRGLAQRGKVELDKALEDFEQALKLYHQQRGPLGVVDTRSARAGVYMMRGEFERARDEQTKAITQVERVMQSLSTPQQWSLFLRQYAELYAQTAIADVRRDQDEQARTLLQNYARIAGEAELTRHLQAYEDAMPISGEDVTAEELLSNQNLVKRLRQIHEELF